MQKINLGIVTAEFPPMPGGVGVSVKRISKNLTQHHNVNIIIFFLDLNNYASTPDDQLIFYQDESFSVSQIRPFRIKNVEQSHNIAVDIFEILVDLIKSKRIDILNAFYVSHTGFAAVLAAKECGIPVVSSFRGNDIHRDLFNSNYWNKILWVIENSDYLTFVSAQSQSRANLLTSKDVFAYSEVIWNGVDISEFEDQPNFYVPDNIKKPVICSAGYFRRTKGIDRLIKACHDLKVGTLLLIGEFKADEKLYYESLMEKVSQSGVNIVITGDIPHSQVLNYYKLADIAVFPSRFDGCSNAFLEAMLAGKPIVCSNVGAMGNILYNSQGGIVLNQCEENNISDAIAMLLKSEPEKTGNKNRAYILSELTATHEARAWFACYSKILK